MTATLGVSPNPAPVGTTVSVTGSGFPNRKTRLLLDGQGAASNIFRPRPDGTFAVGITVSAVPATRTLEVQQIISGVWQDAAPAVRIVVEASPPVASTIRFGMAAHFMWGVPMADVIADLDRMKAAGMTYARFDASWRNMEPAKGSYSYLATLDQILDACQARGIATTITVIETPGWANGGGGKFVPPFNPSDYAAFVGVLAKRYAVRPGMVWEVWNEPNDPHFWTTGVNAAQYAAMLRAAYPAIKAADPDATVITGGILYNNVAYLEALYIAGAGDSFDGLAIHPYCGNRAPGDTSDPYNSFKASVPQFTAALAGHSQGAKPIYITEMGWGTDKVSDSVRAGYLRDAVSIARGWPNVKGMAAYTLHQSQFPTYGLLTTTNQPTASWTAYAGAVV